MLWLSDVLMAGMDEHPDRAWIRWTEDLNGWITDESFQGLLTIRAIQLRRQLPITDAWDDLRPRLQPGAEHRTTAFSALQGSYINATDHPEELRSAIQATLESWVTCDDELAGAAVSALGRLGLWPIERAQRALDQLVNDGCLEQDDADATLERIRRWAPNR